MLFVCICLQPIAGHDGSGLGLVVTTTGVAVVVLVAEAQPRTALVTVSSQMEKNHLVTVIALLAVGVAGHVGAVAVAEAGAIHVRTWTESIIVR